MRALLSLAFCVLLAASASAQSFPSRQIRMMVPRTAIDSARIFTIFWA
jgi:tripartite-type tricarboxylate transporter receptor subunit TctC